MIKLDQDIDRAQKTIDLYHSQDRDQLAAARRALKLRTDDVLASIQQWQAKVVDAKDNLAEAERLRLNINRAQTLYERLATLLQNVDLGRNLDRESLAILEPASPARRSFRRESLLSALSIFIGLATSVGLVFILGVADNRLTSPTDLSLHFTEKLLGQVPDSPAPRGQKRLPLLKRNDERHLFAESCRNLRSALLCLPPDQQPQPKLLLITSALPNEGKSTVAANLARALALGGARVLLVDADLRQGRLDELMRLHRTPGLAELLQDHTSFGKVIQTDSIPNLWFLARGHQLCNPGDLLLKSDLVSVLSQCRKKFDYVLIDSSPVLAADDVTALAPKVDATLFVVRSGFSAAASVREALDLLAQRRCRVLGLILNRIDASARSQLYYKYPGYYRRSALRT
jgi:capsular exopolysaccharide synthesis family protein